MDFLSCRRLLHREAVSPGEGCLSLDPGNAAEKTWFGREVKTKMRAYIHCGALC